MNSINSSKSNKQQKNQNIENKSKGYSDSENQMDVKKENHTNQIMNNTKIQQNEGLNMEQYMID